MLQRLYVNNFRCLENFELKTKDMPSSLIIGKNGTGKSTTRAALEIMQSIGRGINRVGALVKPKDFAHGRSEIPIRMEIEVLLAGNIYHYILAFELPENFKELRVLEEQLLVAGKPVFIRDNASVKLPVNNDAQFNVDWHVVALPLIQARSDTDPLYIFKTWLARMILLAPIPALVGGESDGETLEPTSDARNLGEWLTSLLSQFPASYATIDKYLRDALPDFSEFRNDPVGKNAKSLNVHFVKGDARLIVNFDVLSDGEKCFFLCALVLAANKSYGPLFCFWDEPDNYISLSEVGHFVQVLRQSFPQNQGQLIVTSHNEEAIRKFSNENTWVLDRKSHLEPTLIKLLEDISFSGDIISTLICGNLSL